MVVADFTPFCVNRKFVLINLVADGDVRLASGQKSQKAKGKGIFQIGHKTKPDGSRPNKNTKIQTEPEEFRLKKGRPLYALDFDTEN